MTDEQAKAWNRAVDTQRAAQDAAVAKRKDAEDDPWGYKAAVVAAANNPNSESDNGWNVLAALGASTIRAASRKPDSVSFDSVVVMKDGTACYAYRAQNGFGGMNREHAVLLPNTRRLATSAGAWNAHCAHKQGSDVTFLVSRLSQYAR
jgi:hypothetical protein